MALSPQDSPQQTLFSSCLNYIAGPKLQRCCGCLRLLSFHFLALLLNQLRFDFFFYPFIFSLFSSASCGLEQRGGCSLSRTSAPLVPVICCSFCSSWFGRQVAALPPGAPPADPGPCPHSAAARPASYRHRVRYLRGKLLASSIPAVHWSVDGRYSSS